jgi:peptidoglycan/xylan/chitin deacetylase (PgdA/CDA1 family)
MNRLNRLTHRVRRFLRRRRPKPVILMYHRVAEPAVDPWGLAVSPRCFEAQMEVLRTVRTPMVMKDFLGALRDGSLPGNAAAVTFDDGYLDNLKEAKPILVRHGVPATIFLSTGHLGRNREFWWDELARLILLGSGRMNTSLRIAQSEIEVDLDGCPPEHDATWRAWMPAQGTRQSLYLEIWQRLRPLTQEDRESVLAQLRDTLAASAPDPKDMPMSEADIGTLVAGGLVSIGAHTVTHPALTTISHSERRSEITASIEACEKLAGYPVAGFAYPYGDVDADTKAIAAESGLLWACSTRSAAVARNGFDVFDLPRVQVTNLNRDAFQRALRLVEI